MSFVNKNSVYDELTSRYNRISVSTIKDILSGKLKVKSKKVNFKENKYLPPKLEEAEDAFKNYDCAIFTAFRSGNTLKHNRRRNNLLKTDMEMIGLSYRPVKGKYREADQEFPDIEYCFFAYNKDVKQSQIFFEQAYSLAEKYNQDCFLYKRAGINRSAFFVATNDRCREGYRGNLKFAGQLYINVPDIGGWTDCSDGRFSFQLRGMIMTGTENKKIKIGEGDLFDIESYAPDGLVVVRVETNNNDDDLKLACHNYHGEVPLVERYFMKENQTEEEVHEKIIRALKVLKDKKCKRIGFHCSASIDGLYLKGAKVAYDTIQKWTKRNDRIIELIVINDIYGDYSKIMNE